MDGTPLKTARLTLRPLQAADAPAIAELISPWEVARWLTRVPFPYGPRDAETFLARAAGHAGYAAICPDGETLAGVISLLPGRGLGYWLGQPFWGQGYMSEAVTAVLTKRFKESDLPLLSGHHPGNERSRAVLLKMGFRDTDVVEEEGARGTATIQRMQLTAQAWRLSPAAACRNG